MNKPTKAILLSALVIPGAGHLYLKRYWTGMAFIVAIVIAFYFIFRDVLAIANSVAEGILAGTIAPDFSAILRAVEQQRRVSSNSTNLAWLLIIGCWFVALIDCIRMAVRSPERGR